MKFSIDESKKILDTCTLDTFNENYEKLSTIASTKNFTLRDDSKLIWNYCLNKIQWNPESVIDELVGIDYLYKNTNYSTNLEIGLPIIANFFKNKYNTHWDVLWQYVREWGSEAIKIETMRRNNIQFGQPISLVVIPITVSGS